MDGPHQTELASLTMRADGILHIVFDYDGPLTKELAAEFLAARNEIAGAKPPPVITEIVHIPYVERAIRAFFMDTLTPPPCRAVVTTDAAFGKMYRTYQLVEKATVPTALFTTVYAAVNWINTQMSEI